MSYFDPLSQLDGETNNNSYGYNTYSGTSAWDQSSSGIGWTDPTVGASQPSNPWDVPVTTDAMGWNSAVADTNSTQDTQTGYGWGQNASPGWGTEAVMTNEAQDVAPEQVVVNTQNTDSQAITQDTNTYDPLANINEDPQTVAFEDKTQIDNRENQIQEITYNDDVEFLTNDTQQLQQQQEQQQKQEQLQPQNIFDPLNAMISNASEVKQTPIFDPLAEMNTPVAETVVNNTVSQTTHEVVNPNQGWTSAPQGWGNHVDSWGMVDNNAYEPDPDEFDPVKAEKIAAEKARVAEQEKQSQMIQEQQIQQSQQTQTQTQNQPTREELQQIEQEAAAQRQIEQMQKEREMQLEVERLRKKSEEQIRANYMQHQSFSVLSILERNAETKDMISNIDESLYPSIDQTLSFIYCQNPSFYNIFSTYLTSNFIQKNKDESNQSIDNEGLNTQLTASAASQPADNDKQEKTSDEIIKNTNGFSSILDEEILVKRRRLMESKERAATLYHERIRLKSNITLQKNLPKEITEVISKAKTQISFGASELALPSIDMHIVADDEWQNIKNELTMVTDTDEIGPIIEKIRENKGVLSAEQIREAFILLLEKDHREELWKLICADIIEVEKEGMILSVLSKQERERLLKLKAEIAVVKAAIQRC